MQGVITTRHLLSNAPTIIHEFGMMCYFRCLASLVRRRDVTFLEVVMRLRRG